MLYNTQDRWVCGISPSPGNLIYRKHYAQRLRLALCKGPNRVVVSLFSSHLEFRTMDKVQKLSDSEYYLFSQTVEALHWQ
jgi:hypothetical protein